MTQDTAARDRGPKKKEAHWRRIVRAQGKCGLSVRAFCAGRQVGEAGFYWWRRELARRDAAIASRGAPVFVPVRVVTGRVKGSGPAAGAVPEAAAASRMEIVLPDGRRVQVVGAVDRQALAEVLDVLEQRGERPC